MNIGIICHPTYGGSGIMATELGKQLAGRGHTVHLFSYSQPIRIFEKHDHIYFHKVEVNAYPLFRYPSYSMEIAARIVDVAHNMGLDLVHAHYAIPHGLSALEARLILADEGVRLPFVTTLHGTDITVVGSEPTLAPLTRYILAHSDAVTAVSDYLRQETLDYFQVRREIHVVGNFIDLDTFRRRRLPQLRARLAEPGEKVLLHTSNFRPVKNLPDIITMFARVLSRLPARLVLVGDGPERQRAEQLCRDLGVSAKVHFLGMQPDVTDFFSVADLYVQASHTESFGLSSLEAMACRVPVVAYRVGGVPEVVIHGETGLLVEKGDVPAFAAAVIELLRDGRKHCQFALAAKKRAETLFSADQVVPRYEQIYRDVLSASAGE